jgi:hypothetical protein
VKKSELKKRILEALTPDEASKVDAKYKEIYAGMVGKNPLKMKKYDNPDKVAYGRAINLIQKESLKLAEKLGKTADVGDYKDDFRKSDAPQFKGKSKKKRDQMATAAFLNKEEKTLEEIDNLMNETGQEIAKKNMDDYKRLNELVKAALMKETSTDKYDDNPALKGKQSELPDGLQKSIIKKAGGKVNETLDDKVYGLVDRMLDAMGGSDNLLQELIRAMSTDDAMLYLSAIARDYGMFDDAEEISEKAEANESFDSLVKKVDKAKGYTKKEAEKVAGAIAAKKMKGAGKGPTAKQKKRMAETILKELRG